MNDPVKCSGDIFWMIRLSTDNSLSGQLEDLMKSETGRVVPTRATLAGVNLQISPLLEIKGSVLEREK
jgi:hypothetical protein